MMGLLNTQLNHLGTAPRAHHHKTKPPDLAQSLAHWGARNAKPVCNLLFSDPLAWTVLPIENVD
jgi:hypothetical protein